MERTTAQTTAIENHDQNLIVIAGAGSGKTYVLVERYLALLDAHPEWSLNALVAITFTKKAAQEMRDRVRQALEKRYAQSADAQQQNLWAGRIAAMQSARIDTIHGLCASILRANAAEAGLDPGFEVLDEVESLGFLDDAIEGVLQSIVVENDPTVALLAEYEVHTVQRALADLIAVEVPTLSTDLMNDWHKGWEQNTRQSLKALVSDPVFHEAAEWTPGGAWPSADDKIAAMWISCAGHLEALYNPNNELEAYIKALESLSSGIKLVGGSSKLWGDKETLQEAKDMLKFIREAATTLLENIGQAPNELDSRAAELLPLWVRLIQRAQTAYTQAKQQQAYLDFDDLERLTRHVLQEHPAVRKRYQNAEFKHLLVDEFQDTNAAQWDIVQSLAELNQPGSLFVVGDPKQSIYRFRGADVSVFERVRGQITTSGGGDVALARSFRTHHPLVNSFNWAFAQILAKTPGGLVQEYEVELGEPMQAEREIAPVNEPPIECIFITKEGLDDADDTAENRRRWEAYEMAARIRVLVEQEKRLIYDKALRQTRPMGYGDVAILFQSTSNITLYEDVFKTANLSFVTVAGRGYYSKQEVWDLLNLLTALHNPADNLSLATALRSPLFGLSDDALLALRLRRDANNVRLPLWNALDDLTDVPEAEIGLVTFARECLRDLHTRAGRVTIAELLREALERTGYLATLTGLPDGARRRGNVEKLLDKAQSSGQITLGAFSQYLHDLSAREVREGEALVDVKDAVTLMTVHASKGLEFPLVVLVDVGWSRRFRDSNPVTLDPVYGLTCKTYDPVEDKLVSGYAHAHAERLEELREQAERKRLLYVAMTRAQDHLLITGQLPAKDGKWKNQTWLGWLWEAFGLEAWGNEPGSQMLEFDWGKIGIHIPVQMPQDDVLSAISSDTSALWDSEAVRLGQALSGPVEAPFLLGKIRIERGAVTRHLTATQIADLGVAAALRDEASCKKVRRSILFEAQEPIQQVSARSLPEVSKRIIGEIVHQVLGQTKRPQEEAKLKDLLEKYAWEQGVVHPGQQGYAVQEAQKLLESYAESDVSHWLDEAKRVYREIPFVYRTDKRIIHGVLDTLIERPDGSWAVIDYKTSYVAGYANKSHKRLLDDHAQRYHLQVGVYAAAVRAQLGDTVVPDTYIHYIRYSQTVQVARTQWQQALIDLEATIGDLLDV